MAVSRIRVGLVLLAIVVLAAVAAVAYEVRQSGHSTPLASPQEIARYDALQGAAAADGTPRPGVYAYAVTGWECAGIGPVCIRRSLPHRAWLVVARHGSVLTTELDLSAQHLEAQRYLLTPAGRELQWQRTRISILGVTQDDAHVVAPPTTISLPAHLHTGQTWVQRFTDSSLPVVSHNRVTGQATAAVGGKRVRVWIVASTSVTGGPHPGTEKDVSWHSTALGLDVRFTISRRIGGGFPYKLQAAGHLLGVEPST